jgi:hypothetical protein
MPRRRCSPEENVLRAIHTAFWDVGRGRWSSEMFKGRETSVSRLAVLGLQELLAIFHQELDSPPRNRRVIGVGEINIGALEEIGHTTQTVLTVEEDPTPLNPAHAVIPQNIGRGLAMKIIAALTLHYE